MIENFIGSGEDKGCRTTGCSCCSCDIDPTTGQEEILKEARDNIRVVKKICEFYKIDFKKYCADILTEKQCKKHEFFKKYKDQEVCRKCDYWKPKTEEQ